MQSTRENGAWLLAAAPEALVRLEPLLEAHRARRPVQVVELPAGPPPAAWWEGRLAGVSAGVLVADARVAPVDALPGPFLPAADGARVPFGILPAGGVSAATIAGVVARSGKRLARGPVVLLGSRSQPAQALVLELTGLLRGSECPPVRRLTAERLPRYALPDALACGPGLALYIGAGHPRGWGGYGGVEAWQLDVPGAQPVGAVLSLTCHAASRPASAPSFSEELVQRGRAGAAIGAVDEVEHVDNASLAREIALRLAHGASTVAELLPLDHRALSHYRIVGDPLAPLIGARGSRRGIAAVFAPAVGDELPPVAWAGVAP